MKNKTKSISIRLNTEEYTKLSNISNLNHLSNSEYIRSLINRTNPVENYHSAEIASVLSRLYIKLGELAGYSKEWNINGETVSIGVQK